MLHHVLAADDHAAAAGRVQRGHDAHGRGLARAVGADEADDLPAMDVEVHILHGVDIVERAVQVAHLDQLLRERRRMGAWGN